MEQEKVNVPYIVHEGDMARLERTVKRLWILCILLVLLLVGSNAGWIWWNAQWETVETTTQEIDQDIDTGNGDATVIGIGNIYGEGETEG